MFLNFEHWPKGIDQQCRPRSDSSLSSVFYSCFSEEHFFANSSTQKNFQSVENFRAFTVVRLDIFCESVHMQFQAMFIWI